MSDRPDFVVSTPYGPLDIHVHSGDFARAEIGIPMNVDERSFTINGVAHAVQARLHLWSDGRWHLGSEDDRTSQLYEPRLSRRDEYSSSRPKEVSRSANEKARTAIEDAVNDLHLYRADFKDALAQAGIRKLEKDLERAISARNQAQEAFSDATNKVYAANEALNRARFVYGRQSGGK